MIPQFVLFVQVLNPFIDNNSLNAKQTKDTKMRQDPKITIYPFFFTHSVFLDVPGFGI